MTSEVGKKALDQLLKGIKGRADSVHKADSTLVADSAKNVPTPPKTTTDSTKASTPRNRTPSMP